MYENPLPEAKEDAFLPSVGIVMSSDTMDMSHISGANLALKMEVDESNVDNLKLATVMQTAPPEICVNEFDVTEETVSYVYMYS